MIKYGFVINIYKDDALAERLIHRIKELYPDSPITLIFDGTESSFSCADNLFVVRGDRLKEYQNGCAWILRYLEEGVKLNTQYIIKIDPDTWLINPFQDPPNADVFGWPCSYFHQTAASGGIFGITREAAIKILKIKDYLLALPKYKNLGGYHRYGKYAHQWESESNEQIIIEEIMIADFMLKCKLRFGVWQGIINRFRPVFKTLNGFEDQSAIHPYIPLEI